MSRRVAVLISVAILMSASSARAGDMDQPLALTISEDSLLGISIASALIFMGGDLYLKEQRQHPSRTYALVETIESSVQIAAAITLLAVSPSVLDFQLIASPVEIVLATPFLAHGIWALATMPKQVKNPRLTLLPSWMGDPRRGGGPGLALIGTF